MILSAQEREIAIILVEALVEYGLTNHLVQYDVEDWFRENRLEDMGFWGSGGASKICIGHDDLDDWVIKVGYTEKVSCDYATVEYNIYCKAEIAGLDYYFPETVYLGEFGGRAFYVQAYADCDSGMVSSDWCDRLSAQYDEDGEEYDIDSLYDVIDEMDDDEKICLCFGNAKLADFLMENNVSDFHEGNFGYLGDHMVIVDFSGWHN